MRLATSAMSSNIPTCRGNGHAGQEALQPRMQSGCWPCQEGGIAGTRNYHEPWKAGPRADVNGTVRRPSRQRGATWLMRCPCLDSRTSISGRLARQSSLAKLIFGTYIPKLTTRQAVAGIDFTGQRLPTQTPLAVQIRQSLTSRSLEPCAEAPCPECSSPR